MSCCNEDCSTVIGGWSSVLYLVRREKIRIKEEIPKPKKQKDPISRPNHLLS